MKPIRILQISDLHFGKLPGAKGQRFCHNWEKGTANFANLCSAALANDHIKKVDFIVLCGDMVCSGADAKQHHDAARAIVRLCKKLGFSAPSDWARLLIVPGNHEIDRSEEHPNLRLSKHVECFLRDVYSEADAQTKIDRIPGKDAKLGYGLLNRRWVRVATVEPFPLEFVFLYSPIANEALLLPKELGRVLKECTPPKKEEDRKRFADLPWDFDRGFICGQQMKLIRKALSHEINSKECLRIAITHHNVMPICRKRPSNVQLPFPDVHLLANGMEVIEDLISRDVGMILHGHRHEHALRLHSHESPDRGLTLIGAPTAGLKEAMENGEKLGFNVIEIIRNNLSWRCRVRTYQYPEVTNGEYVFRCEKQQIGGESLGYVDIRRDQEPYQLLTSQRGVERLAELMSDSITGPTILHFTDKATWHPPSETQFRIDPGCANTPFAQVWGGVADNPLVTEALAERLGIYARPQQDELTQELRQSLKDGRLTLRLLTLLRGPYAKVSMAAIQKECDDAFARHVITNVRHWRKNDHPYALDRRVNYALELYRLAVEEKFNVVKCIHICPLRLKNAEGDQMARSDSRNKLNWLVNSAFAYLGMTNCTLSWMPFCFHEEFNQTLVSIDNGVKPDGGPRGVFVGWGLPRDPDLENDQDYSVFEWRQDHGVTKGVKGLCRDIRGCLESAIHPLSHRLEADFPLLRGGKVFVGNMKYVARVCEFADVQAELDAYTAHLPSDCIETECTITKAKLTALFHWVLNEALVNQVVKKGGVLPWLTSDLDLAKKGDEAQ